MLQQLCPYRHAYLSLYQVLGRQSMCILYSVNILYSRIIITIWQLYAIFTTIYSFHLFINYLRIYYLLYYSLIHIYYLLNYLFIHIYYLLYYSFICIYYLLMYSLFHIHYSFIQYLLFKCVFVYVFTIHSYVFIYYLYTYNLRI